MPLMRYFFFVGGVLLALLFVSDAVLPKLPVADRSDTAIDLPAVRIQSDRKWPERVVFDTSVPATRPTIISAPPAQTEANVPAAGDRCRHFGGGAGTGSIRAICAGLPKKAGTEAAAETQNGEKPRRLSDGSCRAADAIWLLWK